MNFNVLSQGTGCAPTQISHEFSFIAKDTKKGNININKTKEYCRLIEKFIERRQ